MLGAMRLGLVLVGVALATSAGAGPRAGKVVRVERGPRGWAGSPRYCQINSDLNGYCIGKKPDVGDRIAMVDSTRVLGEVRITSANAYPSNGGCAQDNVWVVQGQLETGDVSQPQGEMFGLIDVTIDPRLGHVMAVDRGPNGRPLGIDQESIHALDTDGDGMPDLEVTQYGCDDQGQPSPTGNSSCFDVWVHTPRGFDRMRQDRIRNCM